MARKLVVGGVLLGLLTFPIQSSALASTWSPASPPAGSNAPAPSVVGEEAAGWTGVDGDAARKRSRVGDKDNFGYGLGTGPAPCLFYDLREPEDVGVFDYEPDGGGDENDTWRHRFRMRGEPIKVTLTVYEIFVDEASASTIDIDGVVRDFGQGKTAVCDGYPEGGVKHVFVLTGADAVVAADGRVTVTLHENGDDIALDRSMLVVRS